MVGLIPFSVKSPWGPRGLFAIVYLPSAWTWKSARVQVRESRAPPFRSLRSVGVNNAVVGPKPFKIELRAPIDLLSLDNGFDRGYNPRRSLSLDDFTIKLSQELFK